jgi:hypothetical protein
MTQYAVANKKIPVAYSNEKLKCNFIESFFINVNNRIFTHTNLTDFYKEIDKLIKNLEYKDEAENNLSDLIINPHDFADNLLSCLKSKSTEFSFIKDEIDIDEFSKIYFKMENEYLHNYYLIFLKSRNIALLLKFININIFVSLIKVILNKFKKWLIRK